MSKPAPIRYRTLNWSAYDAALCERGSLTVWFDPSTPWHAGPSGKRGAQPVYSDAAIQACLTVKVLFGLPLRQSTGFVASLLKLAGLDWPVPDFSTLCRRQRTLAVQLPYRGSGDPLHLLVDSTGIKVRGEGEWHARKHGGAKRRVWRKVHLAVDEATLEVRAVEITGCGVGDAPMLPSLLDQIPEGEPIASVTADGAYDTVRRRARTGGAAPAHLPGRNREPRRGRRHSAASKRQALEEGQPRRGGEERGSARHRTRGPHDLAEVERLPPPQPRRNQDELHEAPRPEAHGPRLRPPDSRTPSPHRHPQPLHRTRYP